MSRQAPVVVTGVGVRSPLGARVEDFWRAALAGTVGTRELTRFDTSCLTTRRGGEVPQPERAGAGAPDAPTGASCLTVELASAAAASAVEDAGLLGAGVARERVGVCFGSVMATRPAIEAWLAERSPAGGPRGTHRAPWASPALVSRAPARRLGLGGPNCVVATACAAGNSAIAYGVEALRAGRADAMVVGGADEISQAMLMMFDSFRLLAPDAVRPFDAARRGLMLGEGAAALVLEREPDAGARRARRYGRVLGYANVADAYHATAPHPDGRGAVRSIRRALAAAGLGAADVDHVSAHGTGTPANDAVEARAIRAVLGSHADHVPVTALKSMLGHAQGAASAIEAVACLLTIRDAVVPPVTNFETRDPACEIDVVAGRPRRARVAVALSNAFGFGGNIECVVFGAP